MKRFADLSEQEILALAISNEDEDSRIYRGFAEGLREPFPASAKVFDEMADEEVRHRTMLFDMYRSKFGDYLPLIRRQDVKGFIQHSKPLWLMRPLGLEEVRKFAETMEYEAERFYRKAAENNPRCFGPPAPHRACRDRGRARKPRAKARRNHPDQGRARQGGRNPAPHVPAAIRAAGAGRADGRLGLDAGAAVSRPPSPPTTPGRHSWSAWRPRSAPASRWDLPRRCPTTARSPGAARPGFAARYAG